MNVHRVGLDPLPDWSQERQPVRVVHGSSGAYRRQSAQKGSDPRRRDRVPRSKRKAAIQGSTLSARRTVFLCIRSPFFCAEDGLPKRTAHRSQTRAASLAGTCPCGFPVAVRGSCRTLGDCVVRPGVRSRCRSVSCFTFWRA